MASRWDLEVVENKDAEDTMEYVRRNGVANLSSYLQRKMEEWREVPINVGIVGESGVGKSTCINTIRNLSGEDEGAARVGVVETTTEPTPYYHPFNSKVIFWDLPGVGTPRFPKADYLDAIGVGKYDFFLILSDRRFTTHDGWLAEVLFERKKAFFFVRTKFDEAVEDQSDTHTEEEIRHKIVNDARKSLIALKLNKICNIYLISNFDTDKFDFPKLMEDIFLELPAMKAQSMVFTLGNLCNRVIDEKKAILKSRAWKTATVSGLAGGVPIPGVDIAVDLSILVIETNFYLKQFGLDDDSMQHLATRTGTTLDYYKEGIVKSKGIILARDGIASAIKAIVKKKAISDCPRKFLKLIPIIGSVVNAAVSFGTTYYFLNQLIDDLAIDARAVLKRVTQRQVEHASAI